MRCALLFFGLVKVFNTTVLPSIKEHVLRQNPECDVFAHTYNIHETSTKRNGEAHAPIYPRDVYGLTSNVVMDTLDTYAEHLAPHDFALEPPRFTLKNSWGEEQVANMKKQWTSIERVWALMEQRSVHYDRVGFFRLDVEYTTPISISHGDAVVPLFSAPEQMRLNDRMFYGLHRYAKVWATERFNSVFGLWIPFKGDSEDFLARLLSAHSVPVVKNACICFQRIRASGKMNQLYAAECEEITRGCSLLQPDGLHFIADAEGNGVVSPVAQYTEPPALPKRLKKYALYAYSFGNFRNEMENGDFVETLQKLGQLGIDCFFYTDFPEKLYALKNWTVVPMPVPTSINDVAGARVNCKRLKWDPPPELHGYSYLIHVDSSCHSLQTALELLSHPSEHPNLGRSALAKEVDANPDISLFIRKNGMRSTMQEEVNAILDNPALNPPATIRAWDNFLQTRNLYPKINAIELPHTNFFVRKMSDQAIIQAGKDLFGAITGRGLWRDQAVYGYIMTLSKYAQIKIKNMNSQWGGYEVLFKKCAWTALISEQPVLKLTKKAAAVTTANLKMLSKGHSKQYGKYVLKIQIEQIEAMKAGLPGAKSLELTNGKDGGVFGFTGALHWSWKGTYAFIYMKSGDENNSLLQFRSTAAKFNAVFESGDTLTLRMGPDWKHDIGWEDAPAAAADDDDKEEAAPEKLTNLQKMRAREKAREHRDDDGDDGGGESEEMIAAIETAALASIIWPHRYL